jgi:2-oxoglutarate ferredoxin oxidoreductase subunit beta
MSEQNLEANGQPDGTKKPDGPDLSSGTKKPDRPGGTKKPDGPPSASESDSATKKPAGPPGATKPAGPPGSTKPDGPGSKKPSMPPGFSGDGGGDGLTRKDFSSDQDVRWCPGCGDYAILSTVQRLLPDLGVKKENQVFISGIGCSGRFPYYMDTYGMHSIHGRAPTVATGLKSSNPELDVWIVTGDGDALSIGGNHLLHILRRNLDAQILLFNNKIYGLTKGQYSPTSEVGKVTKSTPYGSIDHPFNPVAVALGADATFVARTMDRDPQHMKAMMREAYEHTGTGFLEIYQNCNIFNDGAFFEFTEKETKPDRALFVEDGEPLTFADGEKGIRLDGLTPQVVDLAEGDWSVDDCLVYEESSEEMANVIGRMFWQEDLPRPFGVLYREDRPTYEDLLHDQVRQVTKKKGAGDLDALLRQGDTWEIG